jgi:hypothetical protein
MRLAFKAYAEEYIKGDRGGPEKGRMGGKGRTRGERVNKKTKAGSLQPSQKISQALAGENGRRWREWEKGERRREGGEKKCIAF